MAMAQTASLPKLEINDDGKALIQIKGLARSGLTISSGAEAYNRKVTLGTSPGNGCRLPIRFPSKLFSRASNE